MKNKILFIVGSFRKGSFNHTMADIAAKEIGELADVTFLDFRDLPLFDYDDIYPFQPAAQRVRQAITDADGLWIFCPEYNGSYPGVVKNLLDFASMSYKENNYASGSPLRGKPVTSSGCAGRMKGCRAKEKLDELLKNCGCLIMEEPATQIALPPQSFATGEWTPDAQVGIDLKAQGEAFIQFIDEKKAA